MNTNVASITTIKEALEAAKSYLWDGITPLHGEKEFICHAISKAAKNVGAPSSFIYMCQNYVEDHLEGSTTAYGLAMNRGVEDTPQAVQAFRLAFIDELIAGLE